MQAGAEYRVQGTPLQREGTLQGPRGGTPDMPEEQGSWGRSVLDVSTEPCG